MRKIINCLFLDDFADEGGGAYYFGKNMGNEIEACKELIERITVQCEINHMFFCGSSKGRGVAPNLMSEFKMSSAIVGSPQYFLGMYLCSPALINCKNYIMPITTKRNIEYLNSYLAIS